MIQIDMPMPRCCDECFALDDYGDYPICLISRDQRGYTFDVRQNRMPSCPMKDASELLKADQTYLQEQDKKVKKLEEEISELRETLTEMSMNGGTGNQHDVCKFLLKLMDVIEKRQRGEDCATD